MGDLIQFRDYQSRRDLQVITAAINEAISGQPTMIGMEPVIQIPFGDPNAETIAALQEAEAGGGETITFIPFGGQGIDGMDFDTAPSEMNPDKSA